MRTLNDLIGKLAPARQHKVEATARKLIAEELTLQDLRKAQKRSDMMLSTMRSYVEAMGGSLELVARFPKRAPVIIKSIRDVSPTPKKSVKPRKPELIRA